MYSPYTATEMQGSGQVLADSIRARIQSGQNIYDQAAAPLKPGMAGRRGYPDYKSARGLKAIRDWTWSGHTLRCLKVLTANETALPSGSSTNVSRPEPKRLLTIALAIATVANASGAYRSMTARPFSRRSRLVPSSEQGLHNRRIQEASRQ